MSPTWSERLAALSPARRALLERRLEKGVSGSGPRIPSAPRADLVPAAFSQERMWLIHQLDPDIIAYNSQVAIHFTGPLDVLALERSLDEIVRRHEIYRTSLEEVEGALMQRIHPPHPARVRKVDLSGLPEPEREAALRRQIEADVSRPFRLSALPLVRWTLVRAGEERWTLVCMDHHAVTDGWSRNVVFKELMALYPALASGGQPALAPPPLQFADFSAWQRGWMASAEARAQIDYWQERLKGSPGLLDLPFDRPHPSRQSFRGGHEMMLLGEEELRSLRHLAADSHATMFMALLSVFLVLLHRLCRTDDIPVGTGIANRRLSDTDGLIGMLINTVVLRADLSGRPTFREVLRRVQALTLEAYANQEAPFEKVVEAVSPQRHPGVNALHQVMFNLQNNPMPPIVLPGLDAALERPLFNGSSKFDLYVAGWPRSEARMGSWSRDDEAILLSWEYGSDVFDVATVRAMQAQFRRLVAEAGRAPDIPIGDLGLEDEGEHRAALAGWNAAPPPGPLATVHALFESQAARRPGAIAVSAGGSCWTYGELNERSARLALRLREAGVRRGSLVGVHLDRSREQIAGLLGILKAGGAYVPLDPASPPGVVAALVDKCRLSVVLTTRDLAERLPSEGLSVVLTEDALAGARGTHVPSPGTGPDDLAYVLFTSGTTGEPRAVAVPHQAVSRLVHGSSFASMGPEEVWLQASPLSFDLSTLEIWAPLCNGGRVVLAPAGLPSLEDLGSVIRREGVTSAWLTAGLFQLMVSERLEDLGGLRQLLAGGDVVPLEASRRLMARFPALRLINGYGPTENTTFTCCHTIRPGDLERNSLPIGRPISGTTAYVLDPEGRSCPVGVPGELCTGGLGLAREYLNDPETTAAKFFDHPEFGRLYRIGDLCRRLPDGVIEFIGRLDRQVKVRGYRVEPAAIELAVRRSPVVKDCAVAVCGETAAEKFLAAVVVPSAPPSPSAAEDLRLFLRQHLPDYALPSRVQFVDRIPLTRNGKVDHAALAALPQPPPVERAVLPRTPLEEIVADIWEEVLPRAHLGVHDDFFQAGGHSLAALRCLSLINTRTGVAMRTLDFFERPTIAGLAARVEERIAAPESRYAPGPLLIELRARESGTPLFIVPGGWGETNEILVFAALASRLRDDRPIHAVRSRSTDAVRPVRDSLKEHVEDVLTEIVEAFPGGPLSILGECAASTVAIDLALLAERRGRTVEQLVLLDPGPISHLLSIGKRVAGNPDESPVTVVTSELPPGPAKYYGLLGTWKPRPIRCPLHLILSSRFEDMGGIEASWRPFAEGPFRVHRVAGDHISYIRREAADTVRLLDSILSGRGQ